MERRPELHLGEKPLINWPSAISHCGEEAEMTTGF